MTAAEPTTMQDDRTASRQWVDAIRQIQFVQGPENGLPERQTDAERVSGASEDVRAAARLLARHRSIRPRKPDALNQMIAGYLAELPDITPATLWREFSRIAEDKFDPVLIDCIDGVLSFEPQPSERWVNIGFQAFRKRVQRIRKLTMGQSQSAAW